MKLSASAAMGLELAPGVLELKGMGAQFKPSPAISGFLAGRRIAAVNARFGGIAAGPIEVETVQDGKYTVKNQRMPLRHPLFARIGEAAPGIAPCLVINVRDSTLQGKVGLAAGAKVDSLEAWLKKGPEILGLFGVSLTSGIEWVNRLEGGSLRFGASGVPMRLGQAFSGTFTLVVVDESIKFEGGADFRVGGLAQGKLRLERSPEGVVTGTAAVGLTMPRNLSGSVDVTWDGRAISGEGKVGYKGEKLSGEVTLRLMERGEAARLEAEKKAPEGGAKSPAAAGGGAVKGKVDYVVFGEGDLTFAFTEWLNGKARVIVDPKGYVTVIGKITPQKEFILFQQKDYERRLFKVEARASYGLPVVGNIFVFANVSMSAFATLGPGKFYNIVVDGTYSTDPEKAKSFSIRGTLNISAAAGLKLRGEAGAGLEVLAHDIKAGAGVNGIAGIKGYAEATPVIGYREKAMPGQDKKGEFFIRGELEIAAQPFLGLSGDLFVEVDAPWWSPVPDKRWTWPLFNKEWPIGGSLGVGASVDYVFGSNEWPKLDFKPVEFDSSKFMSDLYADKAKSGSGKDKESKGKWAEKNAKATDPPPKKPPVGNAKPGKGVDPPPAKSRVQPGGGGKRAKAADPNAHTKEGKTVKQLQDEATKRGKKPPGGEVKAGTARQGASAKGKDKESRDEQVKQALAALDQVTARYMRDGASKETVVTGVKSVRRKFPKVFRSLEVTDGGATWDYDYEMSPGTRKKGARKSTESSPGPRPTSISRKTATLASDTVGTEMTIDWLDSQYPIRHPGSPPKSGVQSRLMELLVTDPSQRSPDKFIRGHLLNEHLGGEGEAHNLFPITGNANSQHLHSTEKKIKEWVKKPDQWVWYKVKVAAIDAKLDSSRKDQNYVDCTLNCQAVLKDEAGKERESFKSTIESKYKEKKQATVERPP
ncbi:MAG TPA: DNA/RNA non-specific endonuclease [bacterium]